MTPVRSVAARSMAVSVVALGFAGAIAAPLPALARPGCVQPGSHAAQSGTQLLRINRLEWGSPSSSNDSSNGLSGESFSAPAGGAAGEESGGQGGWSGAVPEASRAVGGVGLGDARSVLIAKGEIKSAAAARALDGRVSGSSSRNDLVVQQAPPTNKKAAGQQLEAKRFGPLRTGSGALSAHARWNDGLACASATGAASIAKAQLNQVTLTGGGNQSLIRVPETISGTSSTGLRHRDGQPEAISTATLDAGKLALADGEVRIRVLRAATLRVSMSATGRSEAAYEPAAVEVTERDGKRVVLDTAGDYKEITLSEESTLLESLPGRLDETGPLPLPSISGLPVVRDLESTPATSATNETKLRISIGAARQATKGKAIAARATAIKISLVRGDGTRTKSGYATAVMADLGLGMLEGAAVAPRHDAGAVSSGVSAGGAPNGSSEGSLADSGGGAGAGAAGLPITGPGTVSLLVAGFSMVIGGMCVLVLSVRRHRSI
jgi:hypothetical protein